MNTIMKIFVTENDVVVGELSYQMDCTGEILETLKHNTKEIVLGTSPDDSLSIPMTSTVVLPFIEQNAIYIYGARGMDIKEHAVFWLIQHGAEFDKWTTTRDIGVPITPDKKEWDKLSNGEYAHKSEKRLRTKDFKKMYLLGVKDITFNICTIDDKRTSYYYL